MPPRNEKNFEGLSGARTVSSLTSMVTTSISKDFQPHAYSGAARYYLR